MKCPQCQAENSDQSKFCAECGSKLFPGGEVLFTKTMTLETGYRVLSTGKTFAGKYVVIGEIGRGGMGVVYKAEDTKLKRTVALKLLPPELNVYPEARERFVREARSAAALSHPNICTVHEVEEVDDQPYIAMEYVSGESLRQKVAKGPMAADVVADIGVQVAKGLEAAHQQGIIHRDIKSANIMVTEKGQAKIMDFGLAKIAGETQLTKEARTIGTIAYMSPEQAQGEELDQRTDLWSLGVVLYEMLTGELPFRGDRESIILHSIVEAEPRSLRQLKPDIPAELQKVIDRALKKKRENRYASAAELAEDLRQYLDSRRAEEAGFFNLRSLARRMKKPAYFIPAVALLLAIAGLSYWRIAHTGRVRWARRVALPEIQRLYQDSKFAEALRIGVRAEKYIANDPEFMEIMNQTAGELTIESDPPGASVYVRDYKAKEGTWEFLGKTPLPAVRMAIGFWRFKSEKPGFEPVETWYWSGWKALDNTVWRNWPLKIKLDPQGTQPAGMVHIQGIAEEYVPDFIKEATPVALQEYFLDKYEVTNKQYKSFVDGGGYRDQKYWKHPFVREGRTVSWQEAMKLFVDKTGVPAPAGWELADYPAGQDDYPVSGVSWYEAAAYAEFAGKALPTVYHWAWPLEPTQEVSEAILPLSNFGGKGPVPAGSTQALSKTGTYDQCGNVKEWCWNAMGDKRLVLGGAWDQPSYMGFGSEIYEPFRREGTFGFRCMKYIGQPEVTAKALEPIPEPLKIDFSKLVPCSDEVFEVIKGIYSYPKTDLEPRIEFRQEYSDYAMIEKVSFWDAYRRYRIFAYIFLPRKIKPPFQAVFYYPGAHAFYVQSLSEYPLPEGELYFKNGRAFIFPVLELMFERKSQEPEPKAPQSLRDIRIRSFQDFARCIDYVETRPDDFRVDKMAYHGLSAGATRAPMFGALEPRLKAIIAIGGGAHTNRGSPPPYYPENDYFNFLPRVKTPFLLANGIYDYYYPVETNLNPFMRLLGTPEKDKYLKLHETGHIAISPKSFKDILDFLDKYLGPVN